MARDTGYICASHSLVVYRAGKVMTVSVGCGRVLGEAKCQRCVTARRDRLVERVGRELMNDGRLWAADVEPALEKRQSRLLSEVQAIYARFPMNSGPVAYVADADTLLLGNTVIELTPDNLKDLVKRWIETPEGRRWSSVKGKGFGWYASNVECPFCGYSAVFDNKAHLRGDRICRSCRSRWTKNLECPECGSWLARKRRVKRGDDCQCLTCGHEWKDTRPPEHEVIYVTTSARNMRNELEQYGAKWEGTRGDWSDFSFPDLETEELAMAGIRDDYGPVPQYVGESTGWCDPLDGLRQ